MEQFSRRMAMARKYSTSIVAGAKGAPRIGSSTHIFEHLLVVGLSPRGGQDPRILYQYPPGTSRKYCDIDIAPFCFPYGASTFLIRRTNSFTALNEVVFGQQSTAETAANSFVFLLNSGEELHYGVCVYSNELVSSLPSFADSELYTLPRSAERGSTESPRSQSEEEIDLTREDGSGSRRSSVDDDDDNTNLYSTLRCYCIISKFPFFKAHFAVLYSLLAQERLIRMQSASLHDDPLQMVLKQKRLPPTPRHKGSVLNLLRQYYETEVPARTVSGNVQIPFEPEPVNVTLPAGHESLLLGDFGLACLFKMLSLQDILMLFNAALLEQKIIVVSKNLGLLSKLVLSMISLLQPLVWQGTLIPVLPRSLMELLDSPVPYIFGVRTLSPEERSAVSDSCYVLVCDKRKVYAPSGITLPSLPDSSKLESTLRSFHATFRASVGDLSRTTVEEEQVVRQVLGAVRRYNRWLLEDLLLRSVTADTDMENPEHVEQLLRGVPAEYSTYMRALFHSQHFNVYATKIIARFVESADAVKTMLHKLNSMIDETEGQIEATKEIIEIHTARLHEYQSKLEGCLLAKENLLQQITGEGVSTTTSESK